MSSISAGTTLTTALVSTGDTTGELVLKTNGTTTAVTIDTSQNVTIEGILTVDGGSANISGTSSAGANIKLYEDTDSGTNYVSFKAPDTIASDVTWTLPNADGTNGQMLQTNGTGTLSWADSVGGPASATDNAVVRFDGTTGKLIQNSAVTIADTSGDITTGGVVLASDGSASNPSFAFSGDPDTGVYKSFTNYLAFATGGVIAGEFDASQDLKFNSGYGSVFYAYGCRAWVSFDGTGTPSIRGSGNVVSITDHSAGQYTLNFTFTLVDGNYGFLGTGVRSGSETQNRIVCADARTATGNISSGSVRIINQGASSGTPVDNDYIFACIFR